MAGIVTEFHWGVGTFQCQASGWLLGLSWHSAVPHTGLFVLS